MRQLTDDAPVSIAELAREYALEDESAARHVKAGTGTDHGYRKYTHRTDSMARGRAAGSSKGGQVKAARAAAERAARAAA